MSVPSTFTISVGDGSGNTHTIVAQSSDGKTLTSGKYDYDPITPMQSSSGFYSGGDGVRAAPLTVEKLTQAWLLAKAMQNDTESHIENRSMGTFIIYMTENGNKTNFKVRKITDNFSALLSACRREAPKECVYVPKDDPFDMFGL